MDSTSGLVTSYTNMEDSSCYGFSICVAKVSWDCRVISCILIVVRGWKLNQITVFRVEDLGSDWNGAGC